jgi:hypothetical protein
VLFDVFFVRETGVGYTTTSKNLLHAENFQVTFSIVVHKGTSTKTIMP